MPLVFANADNAFPPTEAQTQLLYWATIEDITIDRDAEKPSTTCVYTDLRAIDPPRPLSSLRLVRKDRPLSDNMIRPYAICYTPSFLV
jgi:hypothetical protein